MTYTEDTVVTQCYHGCPFFQLEGMEQMMYCGHPRLRSKDTPGYPYGGVIITQDNSKGRVPDACPLRTGSIETTHVVRLA